MASARDYQPSRKTLSPQFLLLYISRNPLRLLDAETHWLGGIWSNLLGRNKRDATRCGSSSLQ